MYFDTKYLYIILAVIVITSLFSGGFDLLSILFTLPGVLIAITFHEYAHALAAYKLGDDTPKYQGRLSLNPLTHLEPIAVIMLLFTHIGWGKPVQVNPNNFTRKISARAGEAIVAAAGPVMNFAIAFIATIIFYALQVFATSFALGTQVGVIIMTMLQYTIIVNVGLGVFNLIPLPPLDGSKVLMNFLSYNAKRWFEERTHIFYIVFIIIWITPISGYIISPIIEGITYGIDYLVSAMFSIFI